MRLHKIYCFAILMAILLCHTAIAQNDNAYYAALSSVVYKDRIIELEKFKVPKMFSDKSAQAWYDEIISGRNSSLLEQFKKDRIIHDTLLLNKCNSIVSRMKVANKNFNFDSIRVYINRSSVANAACYGEGTLMVNLGLFLWVDNDDELAIVLGHELAHQMLRHSDSKLTKTIGTLSSEDFKAEIKDIKKSSNGKYDRLRKLLKDFSIESGKHSRYKEAEADSLGVLFAKNAGYDVNKGVNILLKLDKVDQPFTSRSLYTTKTFFEGAPIDLSPLKVKTKYKGLSSVNVSMNADADMDSVKTHPDCMIRYKNITGAAATTQPDCCSSLNDKSKIYKERALLEIVRSLYENNNIGYATHFSLFALNNNYDPAIYKRFLSLCFSKLYDEDKKLNRFNAANTEAKNETTLKELQDFLFAMKTADLDAVALYYLNQSNSLSVDDEFARMMYTTMVKQQDAVAAYAAFNKKFPDNKYQYLLQQKK